MSSRFAIFLLSTDLGYHGSKLLWDPDDRAWLIMEVTRHRLPLWRVALDI